MVGRPLKKLSAKTYPERVGATIRRRRLKIGLSVRDAAAAAGIGLHVWYAIEQGKLSLDRLPQLAAALRCRPAALLP